MSEETNHPDGPVQATQPNNSANVRVAWHLADGTLIPIEYVDDPKRSVTLVGINNKREIVGILNGDPRTGRHGRFEHGFVRRADGKFESFDCLDSSYTHATGINDGGEIVGHVLDAIGLHRGFVRGTDGVCAELLYPDADSTLPTAINNKGEIIGMWQHRDGGGGGFLRRRDGTFIPIRPELGRKVQPRAINDDGIIAGRRIQVDSSDYKTARLFRWTILGVAAAR